jgi:PAS domain S-box-containing protein
MKDIFSNTLLIDNIDTAINLIEECRSSFLKLFDSSPVCMSMTTLDKRVYVKVNAKFVNKFGFTEDEIIGRTSIEIGILEIDESKKVAKILKEKGKIQNEIITCIAKDKTIVHTVSSIEIIEINGENYLVSSFLDITNIIQQQKIIEEQNKNILDSMNYARIIQTSILPSQKQIESFFPKSFVLSKPKDIVSGDFYWIKEHEDKVFMAVCDCTGHGVPGALISIIGYKLLNKSIGEYEYSNPAEILNQLNKEFSISTNPFPDAINEIKDGMDISICAFNKSNMIMEYAGAYNPIYVVRKGELIRLTVDKIPIHFFTKDSGKTFINYSMPVKTGDTFYLFSDGYADQFGGPNGKKFLYKKFQELILSIQHLDMPEQKEILNKTIEDWKGESGEEQTDDILIVGFKV